MGIKDIDFKLDPTVVITELGWDRIFMNVSMTKNADDDIDITFGRVVFRRVDEKLPGSDTVEDEPFYTHGAFLREIPLEPIEKNDTSLTFRLNMSLLEDNSFLENGRWFFLIRRPCHEKEELFFPLVTNEVAQSIKYLDRIFPYGKARYAYTARFTVLSFGTADMIVSLHSRFVIENKHWRQKHRILERTSFIERLRCARKKFKIELLKTLYSLLCLIHPKDGRHMLLMSESKPYLWGNLKYIDDRIKERGLDKEITLSYSFRRAVGVNNSFISWFKTLDILSRQDFVFVDDFAPIFDFLILSPKTKLIQVWHAGVGFKSVGYGRFGSASSPHPEYCCHRHYDYAIVGSEDLVEVYSEVFGIPESRVLPLGMARLDGFLDEKVIESKRKDFYAEHPECLNKKVILFCPTFRGSGQKFANYDYDMLDMKRIYEYCGDEYIWAFKMHPFIKDLPCIPKEYRDRIVDLSSSHDINDLYYVTEIMITDYSSSYYDFALLEKPVLFYTFDRDHYEVVRGVHKTIKETAPGKVCDTFDELMEALENGDYEIEKTIKFHQDNFSDYDGNAADRIIDTILLGTE